MSERFLALLFFGYCVDYPTITNFNPNYNTPDIKITYMIQVPFFTISPTRTNVDFLLKLVIPLTFSTRDYPLFLVTATFLTVLCFLLFGVGL